MSRLSIGSNGIAVAAAGLAIVIGATPVFASQPSQLPSYWHPWFEIGGYHNSRDEDSTGTTGTNRGETTIFAPIRGSQRTLLFGQLTAKFFDDTAKEGNFALGYRKMMPWGFNLGASIGADVRRTDIDNTFWQLSGGFEALSKNVDFRFNWYGPVTKPQDGVAGFAQVQLQGNQIFMTGAQEVALKGIDGEVGFRLPTEHLKINLDQFELRAYAGGYHFTSDDAEDNITGVKGRLELRVNDVIASLPGSRLTVDYEVSHDDVRDTRHDIGLRMRIPLNGGKPVRSLASLSHQQRRMLDGIERDTDIITVRSKRENVEDALTGTDFDRVAYANAATDVTAASITAGDNSLIIVNGEVQGGQTLQGNQTLQGGGSTISVRGRRSGRVLPFTAPGAAGQLTEPEDEDTDSLVIAGSNSHVSGISVVGFGFTLAGEGDGIDIGSDKSNIFLTNLSVVRTADDAIRIRDDNSNIWIGNVQITEPSDEAINIRDTNSNIYLHDLSIAIPGENGVAINDSNINIWLTNIEISDPGVSGVQLGSSNTNVNIIGGFMTDTDDDAININNANNDLTVLGTRFADIGRSILSSSDGDNIVTFTGITVTNASHLMSTTSGRQTLSVTDSVFNAITGNMFAISNGDGTELLVSNNTFNGPIGGIWFAFDSVGVVGPHSADFNVDSTGNINNTGAAATCQTSGTASFFGEVEFVDGAVVNPATCP